MKIINETAVVEKGARVGIDTIVNRFSHVVSSASIGKNSMIGQGCYIAGKVGNHCRIQNNVSIYDGVELGNNVFCGPSCVFTNDKYPRSGQDNKSMKTVVGEGATIGANATIVCGVAIGEYAFVGAGAVVTKDVMPYALVFGNPAQIKGSADIDGRISRYRKSSEERSVHSRRTRIEV